MICSENKEILRKSAEILDNIYNTYIIECTVDGARTRVTQQEKEKMWQLYNQLGSYAKVAKKLHRSSDTVSRYVREHEAAVNAVRVVMDAKNT